MSLLLLFHPRAVSAPQQRDLGGSRQRQRKPWPVVDEDEEALQIVRAIASAHFRVPEGK